MFSFSTSFYCFYRRHRPRAVLFHGENTALWSRLVPPRESCLACDMEIVEVGLRVVKYELIVSLGRSSSIRNNNFLRWITEFFLGGSPLFSVCNCRAFNDPTTWPVFAKIALHSSKIWSRLTNFWHVRNASRFLAVVPRNDRRMNNWRSGLQKTVSCCKCQETCFSGRKETLRVNVAPSSWKGKVYLYGKSCTHRFLVVRKIQCSARLNEMDEKQEIILSYLVYRHLCLPL